jgi:hypothetical protein
MFSRLDSHDVVAVIFLLLSFAAGLAVWFSLQWRLQRRTEMEVALKREMLEMGMSAGDIERVLKARLGGGEVEQENQESRASTV